MKLLVFIILIGTLAIFGIKGCGDQRSDTDHSRGGHGGANYSGQE